MSDFDIGAIQNNSFVGILENTDLSDTYHFSNLTTNSFSFSFTGLNGGSLQLLNNTGNILQTTTDSETINVNSLLPGNYSLKIVANNPSNYNLKITSANSILPEIDTLTGLPLITPTPPSHNLFESGIFRVNSTGQIKVDYLYDGGRFEGEVGIFNLEGMSAFSAGTNAYIQEAARRAISNSFLGYRVISDITEGARFSGIFTPNDVNYNSGTHQGIKIFNLLPGSQFGLIIAPRDNLQTVYNNPGLIGGRSPLFSMGTTNPNDTFYTGQLTSVSSNSTAFAIEDTAVTNNIGHDYDDIILQLQGATNNAFPLSNIISPEIGETAH